MKKVIIAIVAVAMLLSLVACGGNKKPAETTVPTPSELTGSLEEIIKAIYKGVPENEHAKSYLDGYMMTMEVTEDMVEFFYGCTFEYERAVVTEYMMAPPAFSLSVIKLPEGADVEATVALLKEKIDPMRWVCVGVDHVEVVSFFNHVAVFMMTEEEAQSYTNAFTSLNDAIVAERNAVTAESSLGDILNFMYTKSNVSFAEYVNSMFTAMEIDEETAEYYLGTKINYTEILSGECMRVPPAYNTILIRLADGEDVETAKQAIKDNVNLGRWLCVTADKLLVENVGNIIAVIMTDGEMITDADVDAMMNTFLSLKK